MFTLLATPGLHMLHLANVDEAEFRELMELFEAPGARDKYPRLRALRLFNVRTAAPSAGFFEAISHVDTLTIVHSDAARFLHLLRAQQGSTEGAAPIMLLPRLQTLTILDDASDEVLLSVVGDRATLGYPLQRLNVHAGSVNVHYRSFLQQFVKLDGIYFRDQNH